MPIYTTVDEIMTNNSDSSTLTLRKEEGVEESLATGRAVLRPSVQAATSLLRFENKFGELDLTSLVDALSEQNAQVNDGDLSRAEAMLTSQAHTLDAIFNNLAQRAAMNMGQYLGATDTYLRLALRAQSQCRSTWEAVSTIKHPPVAGYVKQANIAHGPQQVNNSPPPEQGASRTGENENAQNKLLEQKDGEWLDKEATGTAGRADQDMATVGAVNGAKD